MRITLASIVVGLLLAGHASAQAESASLLPSDVHPESLTRLPPLTRNDLDAEGKAVYDNIVGDGPPPKTGPVAISLYSPRIAQVFADLNGYLRYNGVLSPRHTEVAIVVATWEIAQQYEYSSHEPAALEYGAPQAVIDTIKFDREPVGLPPEETVIIKLGRAIMRNIRQNLFLAFAYNTLGIPLAAGALYPLTGWLLSPMIAGAAMSLSSVSVIANALRLARQPATAKNHPPR